MFLCRLCLVSWLGFFFNSGILTGFGIGSIQILEYLLGIALALMSNNFIPIGILVFKRLPRSQSCDINIDDITGAQR